MGTLLFDSDRRDVTYATFLAHPLGGNKDARDRRLRKFRDPARIPEFLHTYFDYAFYYPFQQHHLIELQCLQIRGRLVVVVLPRGFGKTAIADGYTAYDVAYGLDPYIVRFEHDLSAAQRQIQNLVNAFTTNTKMLADFQVFPGKIWRPQKGELSFINRNPYAVHKEIFVRYVGIQSIARGTSYDFSRISLAIVNDAVKSSLEARSPAWNTRIMDILKKDIGMAGAAHSSGSPISTIFITTIQANGDVSDQLTRDPFALVYQVPAIQGDPAVVQAFVAHVSLDIPNIKTFVTGIEGAPPYLTGQKTTTADHARYCQQPAYQSYFAQMQSTWPEVFPLWDFVFEIAATDSATFLQERQHITGDSKFQKFVDEWFVEYETLPDGDYRYGLGIDTSGLPKEQSDPMAIVAIAYHVETDDVYCLEVWCDQATPEELVARVHDIYARQFTAYGRTAQCYLEALVSAAGMGKAMFEARAEAQRAQHPDHPEWQRLWATLDMQEVTPKVAKEVRLLALRPVCEQRRVHVQRRHSQQALLVQQACNWRGQATHKPLPPEFKIDAFDALHLVWSKIAGQSRAPVMLQPMRSAGRNLFQMAANPFRRRV